LEELVSGLLRPKLFPFGKLSKVKPAAQGVISKRQAFFKIAKCRNRLVQNARNPMSVQSLSWLGFEDVYGCCNGAGVGVTATRLPSQLASGPSPPLLPFGFELWVSVLTASKTGDRRSGRYPRRCGRQMDAVRSRRRHASQSQRHVVARKSEPEFLNF
jgi:hypothetical protein